MRKLIALLALLMFASVAKAHTVSLAWTISVDDTTNNCVAAGSCHQTVYRAPGACGTATAFVSLGTLTATQATYTDSTVTPGSWCYALTFTMNGVESARDTVSVSLQQPTAPTGIRVTGTT